MTVTLATDRATFAAGRKPVLQRGERYLLPAVRAAMAKMGTKGWTEPVLLRARRLAERTYRNESGSKVTPDAARRIDLFVDRLDKTLAKTGKPSSEQDLRERSRGIAASIATGSINLGQMLATEDDEDADNLVLVWLSMHDERVRHSHKVADGQERRVGEAFSVGGYDMEMPGDVTAPIEEWIGCRCILGTDLLRDATVAAGEHDESIGVFLVPADGDPVTVASSEERAHVTTIFMGDPAPRATRDDLPRIDEAVRSVAATLSPVSARVVRRGTLGDGEADVAFLDLEDVQHIHEALLSEPAIQQAHDAVEQYPRWTPHVTLGYPDSPAKGEPPATIELDRLSLWVGDEHHDYPLGVDMPTQAPAVIDPAPPAGGDTVPFHGVLVPEDELSGDGRKFMANALTWRELPLPLSWQKVNEAGHDGSVIVGRLDRIWREGNLIHTAGMFLATEEADEAIGMMAEGGLRGVSVDVDSAVMEMHNADDEVLSSDDPASDDDIMAFSSGRISGATLVAIPAFWQAQLFLGEQPDEQALTASCPCELATIDEGKWDGSPSSYTDQQWYNATLIHLGTGDERLVKSNNKLPILTPSGALSRAGVHAAASRVGQVDAPPAKIATAKAGLRAAYKELGEDPPDSIKASAQAEEFKDLAPGRTEDGPGWLTHPVDTDRLRDYWVHGEGAAKIGWGIPGDFNRCRTLLAEYVKPQFLSGYCANRHYDALGFWPGRPLASQTVAASADTPAYFMVASAGSAVPADWFEDPGLVGPSPIVVTEDGRIFGHLATWGTCHIGYPGECVTAPHSATDYAYFRTGAVLTDQGSVPVGHITMGTGHAQATDSAFKAIGHYDDTGFVVADVAAGEDDYGIWLSGRVRPGTSEEQVEALRAAALSGDWRQVGGSATLELVAALAVNVPGFPIPRAALAAAGQLSLVAAGVVRPASATVVLSGDDIAARVVDEMERRDRVRRLAALRVATRRDPKSRMNQLANTRGTV